MEQETKLLRTQGRQVGYCRMYLKGREWEPLGVNTEISDKHRSSPEGDVVTCEVVSSIHDTKVVAWRKPNFSKHSVLPDGSLEDFDLSEVSEVLEARGRDAEMRRRGVEGINTRLQAKKKYVHSWEPTETLLRAAYLRAEEMIQSWAKRGKATGVTVTKPRT